MWKRVGKNGKKYWGKKGAGIFFTDGEKVLLLKRSNKGDNGGTWGLPGGKVEDGETDIDAAMRECKEECGKVKGKRFESLKENDHSHYWTTFFFKVEKPFTCKLSDEHTDWDWFEFKDLKNIKLHPSLKKHLDRHLNVVNRKYNFKEWLDIFF